VDGQKAAGILSWAALAAGLLLLLCLHAAFLGVPALLLGVVGVIYSLHKSKSAESRLNRHRTGLAALGVVTVAHLLVLAFSVQFFLIPTGTDIRPMGWTLLMFFIAIITLVVAVPLAIAAIAKERPRLPGLIGLVLGFTPLCSALLLLRLAVWAKGLHLSE